MKTQDAASFKLCDCDEFKTLLNEMNHAASLREQHSALVSYLPRVGIALDNARNSLPMAEWEKICQSCLRAHSLNQIFQEDPFTKHGFNRPRGYAGDAELLDYIYGCKFPTNQTSKLGKAIFEYTMNVPSSHAVRERRECLAKLIDEVAMDKCARILALGAGHLREAELSRATRNNVFAEFTALDHDTLSLATIRVQYPDAVASNRIKLVEGNILNILNGSIQFSGMDLVYAAGVFDYLRQRAATKMCAEMFKMLRPLGRLVVANFTPAFYPTSVTWRRLCGGI